MKKIWILMLVIVSISLFYILTMHLVLKLNGDEYVEIAVFDQYEEKGAYSCYSDIFGFCLYEPTIKVSGDVDTTKLGEYTVNYKISSSFHQKQIQRKVKVVDKTSPIINVEQQQILTCPNNNNINIKYTALDNYDLDITEKVIKPVIPTYMIDKNTNISQFHDLFKVKDGEDCEKDILNFVYRLDKCDDYSLLETDTTLQLQIKNYLKSGKKIYLGLGVLK